MAKQMACNHPMWVRFLPRAPLPLVYVGHKIYFFNERIILMKIIKILSGAALVITFITGIWFIDDRYVDAQEQQTMKDQIYLRIDTYEYRELTKQYYELKKLVRENPNSEELKEQLQEVKEERKEIKKRINNMLDNRK